MRIGYFTSKFSYKNPKTGGFVRSYTGGGVGKATYDLAFEMARRGHEINVFTSSIDSKDYFEQYNNIKIYRYGKSLTIGVAPISVKLLCKPLKHDIEIIHAQLGDLPAPITAYRYARKKKIPFVITYHVDPVVGFGSPVRRTAVFLSKYFFTDKLLSSANVIIALSKHQIDESKFLKKYRDKIEVIPNGINLEDFTVSYSKDEARKELGFADNEHVILFVGSLTQRKNPHVLLKAMPAIKKSVQNVKLTLIGNGLILNELVGLSKKLNVDADVTFMGFVDENRKLLHYRAADVFVLPSFMEGLPLVLLEASVFGLPLIVSDLRVFKRIVKNGYNGVFTETGNEKDLASKIIYLLKHAKTREKMGRNARESVKEFSWERVGDAIERIYLSLVKNGKQ